MFFLWKMKTSLAFEEGEGGGGDPRRAPTAESVEAPGSGSRHPQIQGLTLCPQGV